MSKEILQQAIDFAEYCLEELELSYMASNQAKRLIEKSEEALAKQEQGEPVACIHRNEYNEYRLEPHDNFDIKSIPFNVEVPLFKGSPAQKPWVGLTDEQTITLIKECRDAFAEELSAWDIEPPLHHVQQGHDNCVKWLAAHGIKENI